MAQVRVVEVTRYAVLCNECGTVGTRTHQREAEQLRTTHISKHVGQHTNSVVRAIGKKNKSGMQEA